MEAARAEDQRGLTRFDESLTIGDAIRLYLEHCGTGNSWMRPEPVTLRGVTRPWLFNLAERCGPTTTLGAVQAEAIAAWRRGQGGRNETNVFDNPIQTHRDVLIRTQLGPGNPPVGRGRLSQRA